MPSHIRTGQYGEEIARSYLLSKGFSIIESNFRTRLGEIDIVARQQDKIIFVEVKTRVGLSKGQPYEAVTPAKLSHLKAAAELYVLQKKLKNYKLSIHVVSILLTPEMKVQNIQHFEDVLL